MTRRRARAVAAAAGALLLLALLLAIAPPRLPLSSSEAVPPLPAIQGAGPAGIPEDPGAYREIVEGNILSPSRRAPEARAAAPSAGVPVRGPLDRRSRRLRLSGIVQGPDGIVALIDADPTIPGAELYRLGDRVGPYRVVEATDSMIVLQGASGTQVLRLDPLPGRIP